MMRNKIEDKIVEYGTVDRLYLCMYSNCIYVCILAVQVLAHEEVDEIFNQQVEEALQESDTRAEEYEAHELALKVRLDTMQCVVLFTYYLTCRVLSVGG